MPEIGYRRLIGGDEQANENDERELMDDVNNYAITLQTKKQHISGRGITVIQG